MTGQMVERLRSCLLINLRVMGSSYWRSQQRRDGFQGVPKGVNQCIVIIRSPDKADRPGYLGVEKRQTGLVRHIAGGGIYKGKTHAAFHHAVKGLQVWGFQAGVQRNLILPLQFVQQRAD